MSYNASRSRKWGAIAVSSLFKRSNDATTTRALLKKWICVLSVFIAIIPTHLLCQMWANPPEAEFQVTISKLRKRNKISSLLVYVLYKTRNKAFPRRSRVKTVKKCTKKVWCTCKVVVLLIKPIVFLPSRCRPRRWILKSLISEPIERWISYDRLFSASFLGRSVTWRKHPVTHYKSLVVFVKTLQPRKI